jgi:hypothetical protein
MNNEMPKQQIPLDLDTPPQPKPILENSQEVSFETMSLEALKSEYFKIFKVMANERDLIIQALMHPESEQARLQRVREEERKEDELERLRDNRRR